MRRLRPALSPLSPLSPLPFACTVKQGIMVRMKIEIPDKKKLVYEMSVSYTHLTLPTNREV